MTGNVIHIRKMADDISKKPFWVAVEEAKKWFDLFVAISDTAKAVVDSLSPEEVEDMFEAQVTAITNAGFIMVTLRLTAAAKMSAIGHVPALQDYKGLSFLMSNDVVTELTTPELDWHKLYMDFGCNPISTVLSKRLAHMVSTGDYKVKNFVF